MLTVLYSCTPKALFLLSPHPSSSSSCSSPTTHMDSLQHLANESFSYSWMINIKPTSGDSRHRSFDTQDGDAFIEMDPDSFFSMRWTSHDFDFSLPSSQSSALVHAEDIFCDGFILPLGLKVTPTESDVVSDSSACSPLGRSPFLETTKIFLSHTVQSKRIESRSSLKLKLPFLRKKVLKKYLFFLTPLYEKVKGLRLNNGGGSKSGRSSGDSATTSPRTSSAFSAIEWCRPTTSMFDIGAENKIYDAVLHCKKSARVGSSE